MNAPTAQEWEALLNDISGEEPEAKMEGEYLYNLISPFYEGITLKPAIDGLEGRVLSAYQNINEPAERMHIVSVSKLFEALEMFPKAMRIPFAEYMLDEFWMENDEVSTNNPGPAIEGRIDILMSTESSMSSAQIETLRSELKKWIPAPDKEMITTPMDWLMNDSGSWLRQIIHCQVQAHYSDEPGDAEPIARITDLYRAGNLPCWVLHDGDAAVLVA